MCRDFRLKGHLCLSYMDRLCLVIGLVMVRHYKDANQRRLAVERGSQSTDLRATHRGVSLVAWYLGSCASCAA